MCRRKQSNGCYTSETYYSVINGSHFQCINACDGDINILKCKSSKNYTKQEKTEHAQIEVGVN